MEITKRLYEAGSLLGIEIIDHLIIGQNNYLSMKEKGYI
jgi:DNA repair protein RadC